jgi:3-hydroxybutyryl-CoA dehydrogenase
MQIVVKASREQKATLESMHWAENLQIHWVMGNQYSIDADAYFDLCYEEEGWTFHEIKDRPVFVNAVIQISQELPANAIRINGWNSFLNRSIWEIASNDTSRNQNALQILERVGRKGIIVPDEPGFIAVRIIAMIINEAYFALEEGISSKNEIDIAMKLGTNYPYGPFEWAGIIGLHKIAKLLETLYLKDERYETATAIMQELGNNHYSNRK